MTTGGRPRLYVDSGLLVKLYHLEAGSDAVIRMVEKTPCIPLPFLSEMEVRNALRVLQGRSAFRPAVLSRALAALDDDIGAGRLRREVLDAVEVRQTAEALSAKYSANTLCRTLDLLHVSYAHLLGAEVFHTGDNRQAKLAEQSGLKVELLEVRTLE
jgi:predicted nucleic acid-binding protein